MRVMMRLADLRGLLMRFLDIFRVIIIKGMLLLSRLI